MTKSTMLPSIGIFGTDNQSQTMISLFQAAGFPVTAIWGSTKESAKALATEKKVPFCTSKIEEFLLHNQVDMVCVSGAPHQYAKVCEQALSIGKHVFSSVPAGLNIDDAKNMLVAAQYYPKLLSLMEHPLRFLTAFIKAKELIQTGYCGALFACECTIRTSSLVAEGYSWKCDANMGGGILQIYGCHIIDIITFLTDRKAVSVNGLLETFVKQKSNMFSFRHITSDDFCSFQMKYPLDFTATVTLHSHLPCGFQQEILLIGDKGYLRIADCSLYGQRVEDVAEACMYEELEQLRTAIEEPMRTSFPYMYLHGLERMIENVKDAFEIMQVTDEDNVDYRNADHNLIAAAANFEDGCYIRSVLDAVVMSNKEKAWVAVVPPAYNSSSERKIFWDSNEREEDSLPGSTSRLDLAEIKKAVAGKPRFDNTKPRLSPATKRK